MILESSILRDFPGKRGLHSRSDECVSFLALWQPVLDRQGRHAAAGHRHSSGSGLCDHELAGLRDLAKQYLSGKDLAMLVRSQTPAHTVMPWLEIVNA